MVGHEREKRIVTDADLKATLRAFLAAQSTLALATVNHDGVPENAPVFYVADDELNLYWLSKESSRHSLNLAAQPRVAGAIYPAVWGWDKIAGLQIEGEAVSISNAQQREPILRLYQQKFQLPSSFDAAIASHTLYLLRPAWLRWLDNSVKFGHKVELRF